MYGELDPYYVTNGMKNAATQGGVLPRVGNGRALFQQAYAGNVAWAHVLALHQISQSDDHPAAGQAFFITDDTPLMNSFAFMEPFLKSKGFSLSSYTIPYSLIYCGLYVTEAILRFIAPVCKINLETNLSSLIYINTDVYFKRNKAEEMLQYRPLFSYPESMQRSLDYYCSLTF